MNEVRYIDGGYKGGHYDSRCKSMVGGDHYVKCEKCGHSEDIYYADKYKFCPGCGAKIIRKIGNNNFRKIILSMQSRQKELMRKLNEHGNYTFFEGMDEATIENIIKSLNVFYDDIEKTVTEARKFL